MSVRGIILMSLIEVMSATHCGWYHYFHLETLNLISPEKDLSFLLLGYRCDVISCVKLPSVSSEIAFIKIRFLAGLFALVKNSCFCQEITQMWTTILSKMTSLLEFVIPHCDEWLYVNWTQTRIEKREP